MNASNPERQREHPAKRFEGSEHRIDLDAVVRELESESAASRDHRQMTVFKRDAATVSLFVFDAGAKLPEHKADGVAVITCLAGAITVTTPSEVHDLSANVMVVLDRGVPHRVEARQASRMLLTLCNHR